MVVLEVLESLSLKPKQTPKAPSNNSTATNSTDDTLTSAKIATPVPSVNNSAEVTVVVVVVEEDSECEALHTEVEDMDLEEGTNVEDLAVVEEDTDVVGMGEEDMVVVEGDMGVVEEEEGDMVVGMEDMLDREGWVEEEEEEGVVNLILLMILPIMHLLVENLPMSFMCRMYSPLSCLFLGGLTNG